MGSIEDCVSRKLSAHLSPGESPTDQDLAIKFSECREESGETLIGDKTHEKMFMKLKEKFSSKEVQFAQKAWQRALEGKATASETDTTIADNAGTSKNSVLGMGYNFHDRIFVNDEALVAGSAFDNNFSQEAMKNIAEILDEQPYSKITREFLLIEMSRKGMDPMKVHEFLKTNILLSGERDRPNDPNVIDNINPVSHSDQDGTTVPNLNAVTDFKPEDKLFGGTNRKDVIDDNSIKSGFGSMDAREKKTTERIHHIARSTMNGGGFEAGTSQALMEPFPHAEEQPQMTDEDVMAMVQNLIMQGIPEDQAIQMVIDSMQPEQPIEQPMQEPMQQPMPEPEPMVTEPQLMAEEPTSQELPPCNPGSILNQETGQCEPVQMEDNPDLDVLGTPPQILPPNATDAMMGSMGRMNQPVQVPITEREPTAKEFDCGCSNKTAEAIKTLYGKTV